MKKIKFIVYYFLLSIMGMGEAFTQNFTVDNLIYRLNEDGSTVTVLGHVNGTSATGPLVIPESVIYNENSYVVTSIGSNAFAGCSGFTGNLTIPNSVTEIGMNAFWGCSGFTGKLTIGNSVNKIWHSAFRGCSGFLEIEYNAIDCNYIYSSAFAGCNGVSIITIGENVERIQGGIFQHIDTTCTLNFNALSCSDLYGPFLMPSNGPRYLNIGESVVRIPARLLYQQGEEYGFTGNLTIPNSVTSIGDHAFQGCSGFTGNLTIGDSVTEIGHHAFEGCSGFTGNLTIPNSVTEIGHHAFEGCSGFTGNLTIPNSVTSIGDCAFAGCSGFTGNLTIPNSVTEIGGYAFWGCSGFTGKLTIGNSVNKIWRSAFQGCSGFTGNLTIPNSVTSIGIDAFNYCRGFTGNLTIPNSVTEIGGYAFQGCSGFTGELTIGNSVTEIGDYAFGGCNGINTVFYKAMNCLHMMGNSDNSVFSDSPNIRHICIGSNVESIPDFAFKPCSMVEDIVLAAVTPPVIAPYTFETVSHNIPVTVPYGSGEAYRTALHWGEFFNIIEGELGLYDISLDNINFNGGTVSVSLNSAYVGEEVRLTVTPNAGMVLSSLTVCNSNDPSQTVPVYHIGKGSSTYGFLMPAYDVLVKAMFVVGNSIDESNSVSVLVYPNPTNGKLNIEAENIRYITVSNVLGQIVYENTIEDDVFVYDFDGQTSGIYLFRIETANGVFVKKVSYVK